VLLASIDSCGDDVDKDRPSGAACKHRQSAKTINAEPQKKLLQQKRMKKLTLNFRIAEQDSNIMSLLTFSSKMKK